MTFNKILPALALLTLPIMAQAEKYPAPVEAMRERGVEVLERFDAPSGLTGYTALFNGRPLALYVTEDGKHALIGSLLNAKGEDLTGVVLEEKVSRPQSKVMWEKLKDSSWIADGSDKAETIVYVFTDPNCPYCKRFWPTVQSVVDRYGDSIAVTMRDYPLPFHGQAAVREAAAAQCVFKLAGNKAFWTYSDMIYAKTASNGQGITGKQPLVQMATEMGVDPAQFTNCVNDNAAVRQGIEQDTASAGRAGIRGTPTSVLIDTKTGKTALVRGAQPMTVISSALDVLLDKTK